MTGVISKYQVTNGAFWTKAPPGPSLLQRLEVFLCPVSVRSVCRNALPRAG